VQAKIGGGRVAAIEILIVTSAVANLIREEKTFQIVVDHADVARRSACRR
jgi:Tfp pilus assembly pilus retraction ATPase PilT